MDVRVSDFVARRWAVPRESLRVTMQPLTGGLESAVARATLEGATLDPAGARPRRLVVKELRGGLRREAEVYRLLWRHVDDPPVARVLGVEAAGRARYLYLEDVQGASAWPWTDSRVAAHVCRTLARLHDSPALRSRGFRAFEWDYDTELLRSAHTTLAAALTARDEHGARWWRRPGDLRRVIRALPRVRARLRGQGTAVIHGDAHPGNVIVRGRDPIRITLIDWSRARVGSPLEDVASWLHSLGCWEPEARRRHDSLLRAYLESRRPSPALTAGLRADYWFASASNGLSGAIRYHLAVLADPAATGRMRFDSWRGLRAWQRVIRRAAALLGPTLAR
jgi:aminoglycoside phosphotransferase (APT) family kinase protein